MALLRQPMNIPALADVQAASFLPQNRTQDMTHQHGVPHPPSNGTRPTDKDPQPSEGQDEKDLGEDEGEDKGGDEDSETLDPSGQQATPGTDVSIDKS